GQRRGFLAAEYNQHYAWGEPSGAVDPVLMMLKLFIRSEDGATMVEMAIAMTLLLTLTLGFVDFGYAFYQWNAATKAVQIGARIASISDPVSTALANAAPTSNPGAPVRSTDYAPFV